MGPRALMPPSVNPQTIPDFRNRYLGRTDHPSRTADGYGSDQVADPVRTGFHNHSASPPGMFGNPQEGLGICRASASGADGARHRTDRPAGQSVIRGHHNVIWSARASCLICRHAQTSCFFPRLYRVGNERNRQSVRYRCRCRFRNGRRRRRLPLPVGHHRSARHQNRYPVQLRRRWPLAIRGPPPHSQ